MADSLILGGLCHYYRPQTKFAKVMFLQVSVCPRGGMHGCRGACMVKGACVAKEGAYVAKGACMVKGACVVKGGGGMRGIQQDKINERAGRILLECILVLNVN